MMRRKTFDIQGLLLRVFMPIVVVVAITLGVVVYNRLYDVILGGFDRKLITVTALTGALIDPADHRYLVEHAQSGQAGLESSGQYLGNVRPMRRIVAALDLTFLYTQILGGSKDIVYILDAAEGSEHSPIGSEDDSTDQVRQGLHRVQQRGEVYVSPIEYQQQWGLSKASAAPIWSPAGDVVASAGADVDISIINIATQNALLASTIVGMISLAACAIAGVTVIGRIARPIGALKLEALRIASGDHSPPSPQDAPGEVLRLQKGVARIATRLSLLLSRASRHSANRERDMRLRTLAANLGADDGPAFLVSGATWTLAAIHDEHLGEIGQAFWQKGIKAVALRLGHAPPETLLATLAGQEGAFLVLDTHSGRLTAAGSNGVTIIRNGVKLSMPPGVSVMLEQGEEVVTDPEYLAVQLRWNGSGGDRNAG